MAPRDSLDDETEAVPQGIPVWDSPGNRVNGGGLTQAWRLPRGMGCGYRPLVDQTRLAARE